jgi:hypothetical protein
MSSRAKRDISLRDIESGEVVARYVGTEASAKRIIKQYAIFGYYLDMEAN